MKKLVNKKAAMELSISTIVIVVLAMSMLILGLVLVKSIFSSAKNAVEMTDDQLTKKISEMFGDDMKLGVYPTSKQVDVTQGKLGGFGIGIKNQGAGASNDAIFSYKVDIDTLESDIETRCLVTKEDIWGYLQDGKEGNDIRIERGETYPTRVTFLTDTGSAICTVRFKVTAFVNGKAYGSPQIMDVTFK